MYNVREYIRYIRQRLLYAKLSLITIEHNEYMFYAFIYHYLKKWIKRSSKFPEYWLYDVSIKIWTKRTGKSERSCYRYLAGEYDKLVPLILNLEKTGGEKYGCD